MQIFKIIQVIGLLAIGTTALPVSGNSLIQQQDMKHQPSIKECQIHSSKHGNLQAAEKALNKRTRPSTEPPIKTYECTDCNQIFTSGSDHENHSCPGRKD
ncbi:hypothetical protein PoMZ_03570 [Pyricularia oryzae]|uniref:C2H2-type domain-containing protein n=1 Tax=Pyricularia oryzae TaxID=318829 RepID=A0A4P7ND28_PYROR|nr:hypothetical protein PoMZ_03570 [Pyricularia oryzae]